MSALPKEVNLDPHGVSAWNLLLAAEDAALKKDTRPAKYRDDLVGVRVLGFFLLDFTNILTTIKSALFHINVWSGKFYRVSRYQ